MTCSETRECLFAFLDSELDAPLSMDLQRHLEHCPNCAREVEIERTVRKRLSARLDDGGAELRSIEDAFGACRMAGAQQSASYSFARRHWRRLSVAGIAAAILIVSTLSLLPRPHDTGAARFCELVVADFRHLEEEGMPVQFASAQPDEVAAWLLGKTGLAVVMPTIRPGTCELVGGRKCKLAGRPAAFATYRMRGSPASLVVTGADPFDLTSMTASDRGGQAHWVDQHEGYTVVACKREGLIYAAVSTLEEKELLCLMAESTHEGH